MLLSTMIKKSLTTLLTLMFLFLTASVIYAQEGEPILVYYKGEQVLFDTLPEIQNGRTFVPMRKIFELFGAEVQWNQNSQTITAGKGSSSIVIQVGNSIAQKNGSQVNIGSEPYIKDGRTMVPLRFVSEAFGAQVDYNNDTGTVYINSPHSTGLYTKRFERIKYGQPFYRLIDLGNVSVKTADNRSTKLVGIEENGKFFVFTDSNENELDIMPEFTLKVIFEDGFSREYSNRFSGNKYTIKPADDYSGGELNAIWYDKKYTYYRESKKWMGEKFPKIAYIGVDTWDGNNWNAKWDNIWDGSHGKVVRVDCNGTKITGLDYNKRLYLINALPILAESIPVNKTIKVGECTFKIKNIEVKDMSYYQSANWLKVLNKPSSAILNISVSSDKDTYNHYSYYLYDKNFAYGFLQAQEKVYSYTLNYEHVFYEGIEKDISIQVSVIPILDTNKLNIKITDILTGENKSIELNIGADI